MRRRRQVPIGGFDPAQNRWIDVDAAGDVARDQLTVTTFNIWFNPYFADERYRAIVDLLSRDMPDVMVFQEVTPVALAVFDAQPWIRDHYSRSAVVGTELGNYGMLLLSRLPVTRVTYNPLPTRLARGFLLAEFVINGSPLFVCSAHLESGKQRARLRARQLRRIFRTVRSADDVVILGDLNMRDDENRRIVGPYHDVWPALRPDEDGFTEDTSINHMRYDSKNKHRHVRFDRVLVGSSSWAASSIDLLGTEPVSSAHPRVFPSDHFGVRCRLVRRPAGPAFVGRRRRFWSRWWRPLDRRADG